MNSRVHVFFAADDDEKIDVQTFTAAFMFLFLIALFVGFLFLCIFRFRRKSRFGANRGGFIMSSVAAPRMVIITLLWTAEVNLKRDTCISARELLLHFLFESYSTWPKILWFHLGWSSFASSGVALLSDSWQETTSAFQASKEMHYHIDDPPQPIHSVSLTLAGPPSPRKVPVFH